MDSQNNTPSSKKLIEDIDKAEANGHRPSPSLVKVSPMKSHTDRDPLMDQTFSNLREVTENDLLNKGAKTKTPGNETMGLLERIQDEENEEKVTLWNPLETAQKKKKKETKETSFEVKDLLPEGVVSIKKLRALYEERRMAKRRNRLTYMTGAIGGPINCLTFTPDYKFIISGSEDSSIKIFDVASKQQIYHIENPVTKKDQKPIPIRALAITSDGSYLVAGSDDGIKIYDLAPKPVSDNTRIRDPIYTISLGETVECLAITPDNKFLVFSLSEKNSIQMLDLSSKNLVKNFGSIHNDKIRAIKVTSDNQYIVTCSWDRSIKVFDLKTREEVQKFENIHKWFINSIAITPDNKYIISGSEDETIKIFDISTKKEVYCFENFYSPVDVIALSPDGEYLFAGLSDGSIFMWDMTTKKRIQRFEQTRRDQFFGLVVSKDADFLVSCSSYKYLQVIEVQEKESTCTGLRNQEGDKSPQASTKGLPAAIAFAPDSKHFFVGADYDIKTFDSETKKETGKVQNVHKEQILCLQVTPNSKYLISSSWDLTIKIFDFSSLKPLGSPYKCSHRIVDIFFPGLFVQRPQFIDSHGG